MPSMERGKITQATFRVVCGYPEIPTKEKNNGQSSTESSCVDCTFNIFCGTSTTGANKKLYITILN